MLLFSPSVALLVLLACQGYVWFFSRSDARAGDAPAAPPTPPLPPQVVRPPGQPPAVALVQEGEGMGALPYVDIVIAVTSPWLWVTRRIDQFQNFVASQRRSKFSAKLLFVMGEPEQRKLNDWDLDAIGHPDVAFVTARGCPDADTYWPGATDGAMFPPVNSSTTCKVLEGASVAVERFRFKYFARIGDDAYLHWDYFLAQVAPTLPEPFIMGRFSSKQAVFSHLQGVFGSGKFLPYPLGMGYVMSYSVAAYLREGYRTTPRLTTAGPEDAAIALHLYPLSIARIHSDHFHDPSDHECTHSTILVHYVSRKMVSSRPPFCPRLPVLPKGSLSLTPTPLPRRHLCVLYLPVGLCGGGWRYQVPEKGARPSRPQQGP